MSSAGLREDYRCLLKGCTVLKSGAAASLCVQPVGTERQGLDQAMELGHVMAADV